jgi:3-hydroxyisobutyrate dehydrogenase
MAKVGFIGVGNMGAPMAKNLVNAGHDVSAFDLGQHALDTAKANGCTIATSVADCVSDVDVVVTMLPAGAHVKGTYEGEDGVLSAIKPGTLLIDSSTIDVATARAVCATAADQGFGMVDAPVSGGVGGADAGTLTFMVGGEVAAYDAAKPYLDVMGKNIFHAGASGNGQVAKVCNNMLLGISMIATSEAFTLGEKLGLDAQTLFDISSTASGQCWSMTTYCPAPGPVPTSPANNDYQPGFSVAMMLKDLKLAQDAAQSVNASTPLGANAAALYSLFSGAGNADLDFSGIIKMISGNEDKV